jgi:hypothetical protein
MRGVLEITSEVHKSIIFPWRDDNGSSKYYNLNHLDNSELRTVIYTID